jgi:hypothetical protein
MRDVGPSMQQGAGVPRWALGQVITPPAGARAHPERLTVEQPKVWWIRRVKTARGRGIRDGAGFAERVWERA